MTGNLSTAPEPGLGRLDFEVAREVLELRQLLQALAAARELVELFAHFRARLHLWIARASQT